VGLRRQRVTVTTLLVPCAVLLTAVPLAAQTTVRSTRLSVDLSAEDGTADVRVEYVLSLEGSETLRFELLGFGDATSGAFRLGAGPDGTPIPLEPRSGSLRAAELTPALPAAGSALRLVARYQVANAVERHGADVRVHVPVLRLAVPPEDGVPDLFSAELRLPGGWVVSESFPTGLRAAADGRHAVQLAVVPSVVSVRARSDGTWRPGLSLVLDLLAGLAVIAVGVRGWRHLRRVAGAAAPTRSAGTP